MASPNPLRSHLSLVSIKLIHLRKHFYTNATHLTNGEGCIYWTRRYIPNTNGSDDIVSDVDGEKGPQFPLSIKVLRRRLSVFKPFSYTTPMNLQ